MNKLSIMSRKVKIERNGQMLDEAILEIYPVENKAYFGFAILRPVSPAHKRQKSESNGLFAERANREEWSKLRNKFCYLVTPSKKQLNEITEMMLHSDKSRKKSKSNKSQKQEKKPKTSKPSHQEPAPNQENFLSKKEMKRLRNLQKKTDKIEQQQVVTAHHTMVRFEKSLADMLSESKALKWNKNRLLAVCLKNKKAQKLMVRKYKRMMAKKRQANKRPRERKFRAIAKIEFYTDLAEEPIETEFASIESVNDELDMKMIPFTNSRENSSCKQLTNSSIRSKKTPTLTQTTQDVQKSGPGNEKSELVESRWGDSLVDRFQFESLPFTVEPEKETASNLQMVTPCINSASFTPEVDFEVENSEAFWQTTRFDRIVRNLKEQLKQTNSMNAIKFLEGRHCKISIYLQHELSTISEQSPSDSATNSTQLTSPIVQSDESVESIVEASGKENEKMKSTRNVHFAPIKRKKGFFRKLFSFKKDDVIEIKLTNLSVLNEKAQQKLLKNSDSLISLCNRQHVVDLGLVTDEEANKFKGKFTTSKTFNPDSSNLLQQKKKSKRFLGCSAFRSRFTRFLNIF
jgi:hypothetical protein